MDVDVAATAAVVVAERGKAHEEEQGHQDAEETDTEQNNADRLNLDT